MVGDALEHMAQVGLRIDADELGRADQGVNHRRAVPAVVGAEMQVVPPDRHAAQRALGRVVVRLDLMRSIHAYSGHPTTVAALKLSPLLFVRPGELRTAEWAEIDLDAAEWRIAGPKMKMKVDHVVPLATQAVEILRNLHPITGHGRFVFPSIRTGERPMSENTINAALRGMGYSAEVHTAHGFRATARTIMDEVLGERVDFIEHQLSHMVRDTNGRAYNRTAHLPARREMMQRWADYLDKLRIGADVIPLKPRQMT